MALEDDDYYGEGGSFFRGLGQNHFLSSLAEQNPYPRVSPKQEVVRKVQEYHDRNLHGLSPRESDATLSTNLASNSSPRESSKLCLPEVLPSPNKQRLLNQVRQYFKDTGSHAKLARSSSRAHKLVCINQCGMQVSLSLSSKTKLWSVRPKGTCWEHNASCQARGKATKKTLLSDERLVSSIRDFPSRSKVDVRKVVSEAERSGFSFSPNKTSNSYNGRKYRKRKASTLVNKVADAIFGCDDDGISAMLSNLQGFVEDFNKIPNNGVACVSHAPGEDGDVFEDVFIIYKASTRVAMFASLRVVSLDAAHLHHQRNDLRLIMLEGVTANNTIFPIAFMICFIESKATLTKFLNYIKRLAPQFWDWLGAVSN
eukprot:SAG11_NODE_3371_length_2492_cov_1.677810_2_plen_370_part_00